MIYSRVGVIRNHRTTIVATIEHRLTNAIVESFNTKIRLIARRAYGFHRVDALIALARLTLSGQRPDLGHDRAPDVALRGLDPTGGDGSDVLALRR